MGAHAPDAGRAYPDGSFAALRMTGVWVLRPTPAIDPPACARSASKLATHEDAHGHSMVLFSNPGQSRVVMPWALRRVKTETSFAGGRTAESNRTPTASS